MRDLKYPSFSRRFKRSSAAVTLALGVLLPPKLAQAAEKILVFQALTSDGVAGIAGNTAQQLLQELGYDVTLIQANSATLPDNLSDYAQVYIVSVATLGDADAAKLVAYVKGNGHLYLTGERPDPPLNSNVAANTAVQEKVLKNILNGATALQVGTGVEGGNGDAGVDLLTFAAEKTQFAMHPNVLTTMYAGDPGVLGGAATDHVFVVDQDSRPMGAIWTHDDLVQGNGCVALIMDINWWTIPAIVFPSPVTNADIQKVVANLHDALQYCGDHDLDGILDTAEGPIATDPANPDTDGDGLCDGTNSVNDPTITQKCIAGENGETKQDSDKDGKIDALDPDDDNDGIASKDEVADDIQFGDPDKDGIHAWLDLDSDNDGVSDHDEGRKEFNSAGVPDYLDPDYPTVGGGGKGNPDGGLGSADGGTISGAGDSGSSGGCGCVVEPFNDSSNAMLAIGLFSGLFAIGARRRRRS